MAERPAALYRRLYGPLVAEAHDVLHDQALAEGVVQDAFVRTFDRYPQLADPEEDLRRRVAAAVRAAPAETDGAAPLGPVHPDFAGAVAEMYRVRRRRAGLVAGGLTVVVLLALGFLLTRGGGGGEDAAGSTAGTTVVTTAPTGAADPGTTAATTPATAVTTTATTAPPTTVGTYVVESGDGWLAVAQKVGVPLDVLLEANGASVDDPLFVGQELVIPAITGPQYTVREGDTWCGIAEKVGIPVQLLLDSNSAKQETTLVPGTKIRLPDNETAATAAGTAGC